MAIVFRTVFVSVQSPPIPDALLQAYFASSKRTLTKSYALSEIMGIPPQLKLKLRDVQLCSYKLDNCQAS